VMESAGGMEGSDGDDDLDFTPEALQKMMKDAGIDMPQTGEKKKPAE
jgi:hypothetical protein